MANTLRIKEAIKAHGLTCQEVATRMGKSKSLFAQMISGNLTWSTIEQIAAAAGCHPIDFMPPTEEGYVPVLQTAKELNLHFECPICHAQFDINKDGGTSECGCSETTT